MRVAVWLAAVFVLAAAASAGANHARGAVFVNVLSARDLGCSTDDGSEAELRVTVLLDGHLVLRTAIPSNLRDPVFGAITLVTDPGRPVRLAIAVDEASGTGWFSPTAWKTCDLAPGDGTVFETTWDGETRTITARGASATAAEAVVTIGKDAPQDDLQLKATGLAGGARLDWGPTRGSLHLIEPRHSAFDWPGTALATGATSATVDGLCEGTTYQARLAQEDSGWLVNGPTLQFQAADLPPKPARILSVRDGEVNRSVEWETPSSQDIALYEVHVKADASPPAAGATPRATSLQFSDWSHQQAYNVPPAAGDAYVWVRTVDKGGQVALSDPFTIGAADRPPLAPSPFDRLDPCEDLRFAPAIIAFAAEVDDPFAAEFGHLESEDHAPAEDAGSATESAQPASEGPGDKNAGTESEEPGDRTGQADGEPEGGRQADDPSGPSSATGWIIPASFGAIALVAVLAFTMASSRNRQTATQQWTEVGQAHGSLGWACPRCGRRYRVNLLPGPGTLCPACQPR